MTLYARWENAVWDDGVDIHTGTARWLDPWVIWKSKIVKGTGNTKYGGNLRILTYDAIW